jgi:hypothetical protein
MKYIVLTTIFAVLFGCSVFAQSSDPQSPSQGTTLSAEPGTRSSQAPSQNPDMGAPSQGSHHDKADKGDKGEKRLKGCLRSEGGKFVLEEKHGKRVNLTSTEDLSSHVNHMVTLHGSYENAAGATGESPASSGTGSSGATSGEQFNVSKVDHESDTCKGEATSENSKPTPYHN